MAMLSFRTDGQPTLSRRKSKELTRAHSRQLFQDARKAPGIGGCVELTKPHSDCLLLPEVLLFEPGPEELFQGGNAVQPGTRQIFLNTPLSKAEVASLEALHQGLRSEALVTADGDEEFPEYVKLHALRVLQCRKFNVQKTLDLMLIHLEERVKRLPLSEKDVEDDLKQGFMYWHGRDKKCRPCLVIRIENIGEMRRDKERAVRLVIFVLEYAIRHAMVPGRVENWVVILDLANASSVVSMFNLAGLAATGKLIATTLEQVYCGRMIWMKILNLPQVMRKVIESCIPTEKKKKVQFVSDVHSELPRFFELNQLERRYGGTAEDLAPAQTYPFRFFPGASISSQTETSAASQPALSPQGQPWHSCTDRPFHEGRLWDTSTPEACKSWVSHMECESLTPASSAALAELEVTGGLVVKPCCDMDHWLQLRQQAEVTAKKPASPRASPTAEPQPAAKHLAGPTGTAPEACPMPNAPPKESFWRRMKARKLPWRRPRAAGAVNP